MAQPPRAERLPCHLGTLLSARGFTDGEAYAVRLHGGPWALAASRTQLTLCVDGLLTEQRIVRVGSVRSEMLFLIPIAHAARSSCVESRFRELRNLAVADTLPATGAVEI